MAWAIIFIYLEECLPQTEKTAISEAGETFTDFVKGMDHITNRQKQKILNITAEFFIKEESPQCSYGRKNIFKWWEFVLVSCSTVGTNPSIENFIRC